MLPPTLQHWHRLARHLSGGLLAALLLATLAPGVSRVLASGSPLDGPDWVELCTAQGMQWMSSAQAAGDQNALDLCGHCTLAAERFAPLLPVMPVLAAVVRPPDLPGSRLFDPRSLAAPQPAARGPPFLS